MSALEDDLFEDLAFEAAEGEAEMEDEFEMEDYADEFEDEFEDGFEMEAYEDEDFFEDEGFEAYDAYESDAYEDYAAEDAMENAMAYALGAEEADEFFGKLVKGLKKVGGKVVRGIKKAAPVVGKIASGVSRVASLIPHPYAQAVGKVAGVVGKAANLAQKLRAEGASEEEALDAFAEMAAKDPRALPIVAGLTARTVLKGKGAQLSPMARKQVVKQMKAATNNLVAKQGLPAVRAMAKIAKTVKRNATAKGIPPATAVKVVRRTAAKVAKSPMLARKLSRPNPAAKRIVRAAGVGGGLGGGAVAPRSFVIPGPARITISAA
jgi:hypothetical protein